MENFVFVPKHNDLIKKSEKNKVIVDEKYVFNIHPCRIVNIYIRIDFNLPIIIRKILLPKPKLILILN